MGLFKAIFDKEKINCPFCNNEVKLNSMKEFYDPFNNKKLNCCVTCYKYYFQYTPKDRHVDPVNALFHLNEDDYKDLYRAGKLLYYINNVDDIPEELFSDCKSKNERFTKIKSFRNEALSIMQNYGSLLGIWKVQMVVRTIAIDKDVDDIIKLGLAYFCQGITDRESIITLLLNSDSDKLKGEYFAILKETLK